MSGAEEIGQKWCILRTAPRSTLGLAKSLAKDGFTVWTPSEMVHRAKTRRRAADDLPAPLMPTFVFATAEDLPRLAILRGQVSTQHASFSIFRHAGRIPLIHDATLEPLRRRAERASERFEDMKRRSTQPPTFNPGQVVTSSDPSFTGLEGMVEEQKGKFVFVCFGGRYAFKVSAWLLQPNDIHPAVSAAA
jgi:hypothetical protein